MKDRKKVPHNRSQKRQQNGQQASREFGSHAHGVQSGKHQKHQKVKS
jgi:hypothetical protein